MGSPMEFPWEISLLSLLSLRTRVIQCSGQREEGAEGAAEVGQVL